ncbi:MAG: YtxH domain-containing protein [Bacteroidales bacterium]
MSNNNSALLSFLLGLGLGAAIIYFITSEKGKDVRKKISDFLEERGIHLSTHELDDLIAQVKHKFKHVTHKETLEP